MDVTFIGWIVLIIVVLIVGLLLGRRYHPPTPPQSFTEVLGIAPVPTSAQVGESLSVGLGGGRIRFVDAVKHVNVEFDVPIQKEPVELIFKSSAPSLSDDKANDKAKTGDDFKVYRALLGVKVTRNIGGAEYKSFDPAITVTSNYYQIDLDAVRNDDRYKDLLVGKSDAEVAEYLIRITNDGTGWRRLPMPVGARDTNKQTLTSLNVSFSECGHGGG